MLGVGGDAEIDPNGRSVPADWLTHAPGKRSYASMYQQILSAGYLSAPVGSALGVKHSGGPPSFQKGIRRTKSARIEPKNHG